MVMKLQYEVKNFTHYLLGNERILNIFWLMKLCVTNIEFVVIYRMN